MNAFINTRWLRALILAGLITFMSCSQKQTAVSVEPQETQPPVQEKVEAPTLPETAPKQVEAEVEKKPVVKPIESEKTDSARLRFENQHIRFDYDSASLSQDARDLIKEKGKWLKTHPGVSILIEGHCDERGTLTYNLALGERRSASVFDYLADLGVEQERMKTISMGEEQPLANEATETAYALNRRVQFKIIP